MAISLEEKHILAVDLRNALNAKKVAQNTIDRISAKLLEYVEETGDTDFSYPDACISHVKAVPAKKAIDYRAFYEIARGKMDEFTLNFCEKAAIKESGARKAYFR